MHNNTPQNIFRMLQRLKEQNRSNVPAILTHRSMSSFSLQSEPTPSSITDQVAVMIYPQNPFISMPAIRQMPADDIKPGLINDRIKIQDSREFTAQPDEDGNYLFPPGTQEFDQINAFYYTTFTLRMYERYAHREIPWAFPNPRITVDPHVGTDANAFYSEFERCLGFHTYIAPDSLESSTTHSADIVSHEAAHAVLDGLRDLYNESFSLGPRAFHESFGDMTAMLVALHDDSLIRRLLDWTQGDLRRTNFISEVAEHLTRMIIEQREHTREHTIYLRNAFNDLTYIPFDDLPYSPQNPETELGREEHNYSRLFTGAFYDLLVGIYEEYAQNTTQHIALYRARDVLGNLLVTAIQLGPLGEFDFRDIARAFITADHVLYKTRHHQILTTVFDQRGLLSTQETAAHLFELQQLPDLRLPEAINTAMAAARYLEEAVLPTLKIQPDTELSPMFAFRDARGYAFLSYFSWRSIPITGDQYGRFSEASVDSFGGLTLMFTPDNKLCSAVYRPVTDEDVHQIEVMIADLIRMNAIVEGTQQGQSVSIPLGMTISTGTDTPDKLVKYPVIVDSLPEQIEQLTDFLSMWQSGNEA